VAASRSGSSGRIFSRSGSTRVFIGASSGAEYSRSAGLRLVLLDLHAAKRDRLLRGGGMPRRRLDFEETLPGRQRLLAAVELGEQQRQVEMGVGEIGLGLHGAAVLGDGEVGLLFVLGREREVVP